MQVVGYRVEYYITVYFCDPYAFFWTRSQSFTSANEVGTDLFLFFYWRELLLAEPYTLDEKRHVSAKRTHGLQTFKICLCLLGTVSVNLIPISR